MCWKWSDWVEQFEVATNVNGWHEPVKFKLMSLSLSGHACDNYNGVSVKTKGSYALLKVVMLRY